MVPVPGGFGLFFPCASCSLGDTAGTCLRSRSWFCGGEDELAQRASSPAGRQSCKQSILFLLPPAFHWQGNSLKQCPGAPRLLPICFAWLEKAQLMWQFGDKQGCLHEAGFPWAHPHIPPPAFAEAELGNKAHFLTFPRLYLAQEQACRNPCSWQGLRSGWDSMNRLETAKSSLRKQLSLPHLMPRARIWI